MSNVLTDQRAMRILEERLAVLNGDRGNPLDYALRRRELQELQAFIGREVRRLNLVSASITTLEGELATLEADLAALSGDIPPILADIAALDARIDVLEAAGPGGGEIIIYGGDVPATIGPDEIVIMLGS